MDAFYFWNGAFLCHVSYELKADSTPPVECAQVLTLLQGLQRSKTRRLPTTTMMMREDRDQCFKFKFSWMERIDALVSSSFPGLVHILALAGFFLK
jgi:hypothetical protein